MAGTTGAVHSSMCGRRLVFKEEWCQLNSILHVPPALVVAPDAKVYRHFRGLERPRLHVTRRPGLSYTLDL